VSAMKQVSQHAVMEGGEVTTAGTVKMWEWSASIHQKRYQVEYFELFLKTGNWKIMPVSSFELCLVTDTREEKNITDSFFVYEHLSH